jgi:hypothetical protein
MAIVKFISTQYLKANTAIEQNVDDDKLTPYIIKAQETHLQKILGSSFYDYLSSAVQNATLNALEESLIRDYIQRLVAEYAFYEAYPFLNYKTTNKAISKQNSDNSNPSDLSEIKYMRSAILDMAQFYSARLAKYLCDHQSDFPQYNDRTLPENLPRDSRSYFGGIYIPRSAPSSTIRTYDDPSNECEDC